jgi:beta-N-acetylhexosaminidase
MSQQPRSAFTPGRRLLAALSLAVLAVCLVAGADAAHVLGTEEHPRAAATARSSKQPEPDKTRLLSGSGSSAPHASWAPAPPPHSTSPVTVADPASWSSQQLAAVLVMTGAKMTDSAAIEHAAARGIGGVALFGPSSPNLAQTLARARGVAPQGYPPLIASDEEGGQVQRLSSLIYPLPSAEVMGHWSPTTITTTARAYGLRMKALGVTVALAPDTDIAVVGHFIAAAHRSFSADPGQVGVDVTAWNDGLAAAGVLGVIKHWPGHGQASDTHVGAASVPPWSTLQQRDVLAFTAAFAHHAQAVIVGHLRVPGLTEASLPASESPTALRTLRAEAGPTALILTDDLSMAAASTSLGITPAQAAVHSLVAGADVAMVCWNPVDEVTSAVSQAINDGRLPRSQAVASARRVLHTKVQVAVRR